MMNNRAVDFRGHYIHCFFEECPMLCYITIAGVAKLLAILLKSELTMF